jgi:long-subunit fatty acid transport protein
MFAANPAHAFNDDPATALLPISYASPGARAAAMGGAFIGLSDDSSAAFLNPAGMLLLADTEVTVEWRRREADSTYFNRLPQANARAGDSSESGISYLSVAIPLERWAFGVYYGSLSNADFRDAVSSAFPRPGSPGQTFVATSARLKLDDTYFGGSVAGLLTDDLRWGAAVYQVQRDLSAQTTRQTDPVQTLASRSDDDDIGYNVGLYWSIDEAWSLGLSHRSRLEFDLATTLTSPPSLRATAAGGSTVIPSATTLGIGYRPNDRWALVFDLSHVAYSELISRSNAATRADPAAALALFQPGAFFGERALLDADDVVNPRFGVEYAIPTGNGSLFLRGGYWRDQFGGIVGRGGFTSLFLQDQGSADHVTAGIGLTSRRFGVDVAVDYSERDLDLVTSVVMYF